MDVTAQNRGQACSPTRSRSDTTLTCGKSLTLFIILAVMQRVESATTPTGKPNVIVTETGISFACK